MVIKMKINFLTTRIVEETGGAKYDYNLFQILKNVYQDSVSLYDDKIIQERFFTKKSNLLYFNNAYNSIFDEIMNCDVLFMNSRIYTRLVKCNLSYFRKKYPNTNVVIIHHHFNYMSHTGIIRQIHKYFEFKMIKFANQLIVPNIYVVDLIKKELDNPQIIFLESSFERKDYTISDQKTNTLLFVGNVQERKGLLYGLKAFLILHKALPKYKFNIVGKYNKNDKYYNKLQKFIKDNNLNESVTFSGRVSDEELNEAYSNADVFLFPSLLEGYGWVMIEAMGRGLPVVAFDNSAMPYTVRDNKNGLLIENKNYIEMGNRLVSLLKDKELLHNLQLGALNTYNSVQSQELLNSKTREYLVSLQNN